SSPISFPTPLSSHTRWCRTACASSRGGRTAKPRSWCCRNISNIFSPRCACASTPWPAARITAASPRRAVHNGAAFPLSARRQVRLGSFNTASHTLAALQRAVLREPCHSHGGGAADFFPPLSGSACLHPLLCANQSLAIAHRLRHQGRVARYREDSARRLHHRLQAPIGLGDLCALCRAGRPRLYPQARTDVDSAVRLVHLEGGAHS